MYGSVQWTLDPNNQWLKAETVDRMIVRVWCALCTKHFERIHSYRNFSDAFAVGIRGSALKKDNVSKHSKTWAHIHAEQLERGGLPTSHLYQQTPIGTYVMMGKIQLQPTSLCKKCNESMTNNKN